MAVQVYDDLEQALTVFKNKSAETLKEAQTHRYFRPKAKRNRNAAHKMKKGVQKQNGRRY